MFREPNGGEATPPHLIVVQEHPLGYSTVSDGIRRILADAYELKRTFTALDPSHPSLVYDRDDAFFVPLAGFGGVSRPGPNLAIHARKVSSSF